MSLHASVQVSYHGAQFKICSKLFVFQMAAIIPEKLQSLRESSVARRIEAEKRRNLPRQQRHLSGKQKLSKYRRKCANAKVRSLSRTKYVDNHKLLGVARNLVIRKGNKLCSIYLIFYSFLFPPTPFWSI